MQPSIWSTPSSSAAIELATASDRLLWAWMPTWQDRLHLSIATRLRASSMVIAPAESTTYTQSAP